LQAQGWDVSHEVGNPSSADRRPHFKDRFKMHAKSPAVKRAIAAGMLKTLQENKRSQPVVGDISWANTSYAEALLELDDRTQVVFQTRPHAPWVRSHMAHHPRVRRWETTLLQTHGISSKRLPDRCERLIAWGKSVLTTTKELKAKFPGRVAIVPVGPKLDAWGAHFLRWHGATVRWDGQRGRNASGSSRDGLRHAVR
jgi:hypothetical protein